MEIPQGFLDTLASYGLKDNRVLQQLATIIRPLNLSAGEYLFKAGEPCRRIYFLVDGWVKYFHVDFSGKEYVRYFCHGGHFVTAYGSLISGQASLYTVQTISAASLLYFEWEKWQALAMQYPECKAIQDQLLGEALIRSEERERSLIIDDATTRYLALLSEFPDIETNIRQYDIAAWLGITPIALSRLRGKKMPKTPN